MSIPRNGRGRPVFGKIQLTGIDYISKIGLSPFDTALLFYLIGLAKYNGLIYSSQREIAAYMGSHPSNINQAIKRLIAFGLIRKEEKVLKIDPLICQFGNSPMSSEEK